MNVCHFIGNCGKTPEIRYQQSGDPVANLSIAVTKRWKNQAGEKQERTTWVRLVAFKGVAKIIGDYVDKGSKIAVVAEYQERKWQDQSGQDRYSSEFVVNQIELLSSASGNTGGNQDSGTNSGSDGGWGSGGDDLNDPIPF